MSLSGDLTAWRKLIEGDHADLIDKAKAAKAGDVRDVVALRKLFPAELVPIALELAAARRKAQVKWPDIAEQIVADVAGIEMATPAAIARHKAGRCARVDGPVFDLCCGIGGDAVALTQAGRAVTAVDLVPLRAWMAGRNADCGTLAADATTLGIPPEALVHLDPARRDTSGRRVTRLDDMLPGPDAVRTILKRAHAAAVKLAPGVDGRELADGETEFISLGGRLLQQVLWTSALADRPEANTATVFCSDGRLLLSLSDTPGVAPITDTAGSWIHSMDPAIERARLAHTLCDRHGLLGLADPGTGLLTGPDPVRTPGLTAYRVLDDLPWQAKRVRRRLRELGAGIVTVKTRGGAVNPDRLQADLRGAGNRPLTVFVQRLGQSVGCLICEDGPRDDFPADSGDASSVHPNTR